MAKAPHRNPFGEEEEPAKFDDFDVFAKIRVLHQLSIWTLGNAERIRGMMPQEDDQLAWRIEPIGWDKDDRAYFVLDDDRLYRRTDDPVPPPSPKTKPKPKPKSKPAKKNRPRGTRSSKRIKLDEDSAAEEEASEEVNAEGSAEQANGPEDGHTAQNEDEGGLGFTSKTWECIAITLEEYQDFLATIFRSRDANEKQLRKVIEEKILPVIESRAEKIRQKQLKQLRDLETLQKMATAKRSSRLAGRAEKEKQEREEREAEEKRQRELQMAHEEQEKQRRIEDAHESRRLTREQRLKDREVKRILHEEELARLEEATTRASSQDPSNAVGADGSKRLSERQIKTQKERHQQELDRMAEEEENWVFDCAMCGVHGENLDDGTHSIACERCNVWQHSKCHGFSPKTAEKDGFHFVCGTCKRKEAEAKKPKIPPLKLSKRKSPEVQIPPSVGSANGSEERRAALPPHVARQLDNIQYYQPPATAPGPFGQVSSYQGYPPVSNFAPYRPSPPQQPWQGNQLPPPARRPSSGYASSPTPPAMAGHPSPSQQHYYMHQQAVASAGAYPGHQPSYSPHPYPYSHGGHHGAYASANSPSQYQQYSTRPPSVPHNQQVDVQRPPQHYYPNGARSPPGSNARPAAAPPHYDPNRQPPLPSTYSTQHQVRSPSTAISPSASPYSQYASSSPVKAPQAMQQMQYQQPPQAMQHLAQTPQQAQPAATSNGQAPRETPHQPHPSPAGSNATAVAADGMSGPWYGGNAIPQKHDQTPAAPGASPAFGENKIVPPMQLVPSPHQQNLAELSGSQSVPVKKMPSPNGRSVELPRPALPADTNDNGGHDNRASVADTAAPELKLQQTPILSRAPVDEDTKMINGDADRVLG